MKPIAIASRLAATRRPTHSLSSYPAKFPTPVEAVVTLTNPTPHLWVLEFHNGADNRLSQDLIDNALQPALDHVEAHWRTAWRTAQADAADKDKEGGKGALVIVGRRDQDKFFSNGLEFEKAFSNPSFFPSTFNPLLTRLLTYPIPTVAAINGHCFAGGAVFALACDYRVMTDGSKRNAWFCMNEVHIGAALPLSVTALLRAKASSPTTIRRIALEGHKFTPQESLDAGLVDVLVAGETTEVLARAQEVAEGVAGNARTGVWGLIKRDLYRDAWEAAGRDERVINAAVADDDFKARFKL